MQDRVPRITQPFQTLTPFKRPDDPKFQERLEPEQLQFQPMSLGSGRCNYHPERAGIGICVECRNVICQECTTQFEGINRCATCLSKRLQAAKQLVKRNDWSFGNLLLAVMAIATLFGAIYGLASVVR